MAIKTIVLGGASNFTSGVSTTFSLDLVDSLNAAYNNAILASMTQVTSNYQQWKLLETLSPSGVSTVSTTGTLPVCKAYKIHVYDMTLNNTESLTLKINNVGGTSYAYKSISSTTITDTTGAAYYPITLQYASSDTVEQEIYMNGKSVNDANGTITFRNPSTSNSNNKIVLGGRVTLGALQQITSITVAPTAGNMTGTIKVFGSAY